MVWGKAYLGTAVVFLVLDAVWLTLAGGFYRAEIGHLMRASPDWAVAAVFYLGYIAGIVWLAVRPAASAGQAVLSGAVLGAVAYGTYEFTNLATLRDWSPTMVAADMLWGVVVTAAGAFGGYRLGRGRDGDGDGGGGG